MKEKVLEILRQHDINNRVHLNAICASTGLSRDTIYKIIIPELIRDGVPVCSIPGKGGYYIAKTPDELNPGIADLLSRVKEHTDRVISLRAAFYKQECPDFLKINTLGG